MPLYFRYVAGNIVDVTTLKTTLSEIRMYGIDVNYAILDAGYYSESNIRELQNAKNFVKYRERLVYIKRVDIDLFGKDAYAYIAEDIDRKHDEIKKHVRAALDNNDISSDEMNVTMRTKGLFILISAEKIEIGDILPLYLRVQSSIHI